MYINKIMIKKERDDLDFIINFIVDNLIILPGLLIAITFHELAHGLAAYKLGDPTAKDSGRLTLNPIKHIDIIGFILLLTVKFGWAKPVPINPMYFKNRKLGTIIVSIAGPLTNFLLAILGGIFLSLGIIKSVILLTMIKMLIIYNIALGIFNLLPFPPLDGSKVVASLLPTKYEILFYKNERYLYVILILLVITGGIGKILFPLINASINMLNKVLLVFILKL